MTWNEFFRLWFKKVFNGTAAVLDHDSSGAEIEDQKLRPYVLLQSEVHALGEYGNLLRDLNEKRRQIAESLHLFDGTALDATEIKVNMDLLFDDAKREAYKLATIAKELNMATRPDITIKEHIQEIHQKLSKVKDSTIRDNLVETANSKTKQLIELGKIAVYKARVETKVTRLEAFLGELRLGVMRAGLEESLDYQEEVAQSVKSIRSSFEVVDQFRTDIKLLEESADKKAEEIPYYLRYKGVWSDEVDEPEGPQSPAPEYMMANGTAGEETSQTTTTRRTMAILQEEDDTLTLGVVDGSTVVQTSPSPLEATKDGEEEVLADGGGMVRVQCPMCSTDLYIEATPEATTVLCSCKNLLRIEYKDYQINVSPLRCPHCDGPGPFTEVSIAYNDKVRRLRCGSCAKYFKETSDLKVHVPEDNLYGMNKVFSAHHRRIADIMGKSVATKRKLSGEGAQKV
jgi:hypothetical protein